MKHIFIKDNAANNLQVKRVETLVTSFPTYKSDVENLMSRSTWAGPEHVKTIESLHKELNTLEQTVARIAVQLAQVVLASLLANPDVTPTPEKKVATLKYTQHTLKVPFSSLGTPIQTRLSATAQVEHPKVEPEEQAKTYRN